MAVNGTARNIAPMADVLGRPDFRLVGTVPHPRWPSRPMGTMEVVLLKYYVVYLN